MDVISSAIVLCETRLISGEEPPHIDGYSAYTVSRKTRNRIKGGGLGIYVLDSISSNRVENLSKICTSYESIGVEINLGANNMFYLCGVYRPPQCNINDFNNTYFEMIRRYVNNKKCMVVGDFNIDLMSLHSVTSCQNVYDNFISETKRL